MVQRHEHDIEALRELGWAEVRVREENLAHFNGPVEPKTEKLSVQVPVYTLNPHVSIRGLNVCKTTIL